MDVFCLENSFLILGLQLSGHLGLTIGIAEPGANLYVCFPPPAS